MAVQVDCSLSFRRRAGRVGTMSLLAVASAFTVVVLSYVLWRMADQRHRPSDLKVLGTSSKSAQRIVLYCAAGMRYPMAEIVKRYEQETGIQVETQYGGSNTLLSQLEVARSGDLYLAADESYIEKARRKGLVAESIPLAHMRPIIAVPRDNPHRIASIDDLLQKRLKLALGDPEAAAVGKKTRRLLQASGQWERIEQLTRRQGVFKPTVNEAANAVKIGTVDAAIVWDTTAAQYSELTAITVPELDAGEVLVTVGIVTASKQPTAALRFARYAGAEDRGLESFRKHHFRTVAGDMWEETPKLTFFAGAVNRRAVSPVLEEFARREGIQIETVFNGCGILTAQMRSLRKSREGFPDAYMACDVYYLDAVQDWFQERVDISETDIGIIVERGNPKQIQSLSDLARPGIRVALGQPKQCTIGVLSRRLLESEGLYQKIAESNLVTETPSSAMLVPSVVTGSADATLAYRVDARNVAGKIEFIEVDSPLAKAIQPFAISRFSPRKQLARRLFQHLAQSRDLFEQIGFRWRLGSDERSPSGGAGDAGS